MTYSSQQLAAENQLHHIGEDQLLSGLCTIRNPHANSLCFAKDLAAIDWKVLQASAPIVVIGPFDQLEKTPAGVSCIVSDKPRLDFARLGKVFSLSSVQDGIAATANVDKTSEVGIECTIGHNVVIEPNVVIGRGLSIGPNSVIHQGVVIGDNVTIGANTVIGSTGFGLERDEAGNSHRLPHVGGVEIGDGCEIGASVVIARGTIEPTVLRSRVRIDDHVFIAHNAYIDDEAYLIANCMVCGSVKVGARAWIAPNASVRNGCTIGADAVVGLGAVVVKDVPAGVTVLGNPAQPQ